MEEHGKLVHGNLIIENKVIENKRLELTSRERHYFLGPGLTLRNCTLVLKIPSHQLFTRRVSFINCTFEVKQELKNHQDWIFAALKDCQFKGRLSNCDFGHWPEYAEQAEQGGIEGCDFSEASLDACRFLGCDERTLRFPRWPCFTFLKPIARAPELRSVQWPGLFGRVVIEQLHAHPAATRALTYYAPALARRMETTPEALRAVIERFDCIFY